MPNAAERSTSHMPEVQPKPDYQLTTGAYLHPENDFDLLEMQGNESLLFAARSSESVLSAAGEEIMSSASIVRDHFMAHSGQLEYDSSSEAQTHLNEVFTGAMTALRAAERAGTINDALDGLSFAAVFSVAGAPHAGLVKAGTGGYALLRGGAYVYKTNQAADALFECVPLEPADRIILTTANSNVANFSIFNGWTDAQRTAGRDADLYTAAEKLHAVMKPSVPSTVMIAELNKRAAGSQMETAQPTVGNAKTKATKVTTSSNSAATTEAATTPHPSQSRWAKLGSLFTAKRSEKIRPQVSESTTGKDTEPSKVSVAAKIGSKIGKMSLFPHSPSRTPLEHVRAMSDEELTLSKNAILYACAKAIADHKVSGNKRSGRKLQAATDTYYLTKREMIQRQLAI